MSQPWWVYGVIALLCAILIIVIKIIKAKVLRDDMDLFLVTLVAGIVGIITTVMMLTKLGSA